MSTQKETVYRNELADALTEEKYPGFANMLYGFRNVKLMEKDDPCVGKVSTSTLFINEGLATEEACFVARHEIFHILYQHHQTEGDRDHDLWNMAADLEISNMYSAADSELLRKHDATGGSLAGALDVHKPEYAEFAGMLAEEAYDILYQRREQEQQDGQEGQGESSGQPSDGQPQSGGGANSGKRSVEKMLEDAKKFSDLDDKVAKNLRKKLVKAETNEPTEEQKQGKKPCKRVGTGKRKEAQQNPGPQQTQEKSESDPNNQGQKQGNDTQDTEPEEIEGDGSGVGFQHAEFDGQKPEPTKVKLLRSLKGVFGKQKYYTIARTYSKPNRRFFTPPGMTSTPMTTAESNGVIRKGKARKYKETLTLGVYCDVSYSMTQEKISLALGTCQEIDKIKRCAVKTYYFDTVVKDHFFKGGGTNYNAVLAHAKEQGFRSIAIITDDSNMGIPSGVYEFDNLWIIGVEHSGGDKKESYSMGPQVVDGTVKVKHFDGFVVCTEDEYNNN